MEQTNPGFLLRQDLPQLLTELQAQGYRLHGPQVRDGAIVYDDLASVAQLPQGWQDQQAPGQYRLIEIDSERQFNWANGAQALKPLLYPARDIIWQAKRLDDGSIQFLEPEQALEKVAVIGAKACDIAALKLQDKHFLQGEFVDPGYQARRKGLFLVALNCSYAADTCFCASTGDGPEHRDGYDLLLTELEQGFLVASGSDAGQQIMAALPLTPAMPEQLSAARIQGEQVAQSQQRQLQTIAVGTLDQRRDHPQWQDIAERCLACSNCTMVCPTCFCHQQSDELSLAGDSSNHVREWDSCFGESHGQLAGFQVRSTIKSRYQQWMIHKLDSWQEQYGRSGCTGCGRCTTWCPAAIDFVAEANLLAGEDHDG